MQENIKSLITHLVETFYSRLEHVDYVDTFRALKLKYDQVTMRRCIVLKEAYMERIWTSRG